MLLSTIHGYQESNIDNIRYQQGIYTNNNYNAIIYHYNTHHYYTNNLLVSYVTCAYFLQKKSQ